MLTIICLIWVGIMLDAPAWYYVALGIISIANIFRFSKIFAKAQNEKDNGGN